jgi:hypothetical protein
MSALIIIGVHDYFTDPRHHWLGWSKKTTPVGSSSHDLHSSHTQTTSHANTEIELASPHSSSTPSSTFTSSIAFPPTFPPNAPNAELKALYELVALARQRRASKRAELAQMSRSEEQSFIGKLAFQNQNLIKTLIHTHTNT